MTPYEALMIAEKRFEMAGKTALKGTIAVAERSLTPEEIWIMGYMSALSDKDDEIKAYANN